MNVARIALFQRKCPWALAAIGCLTLAPMASASSAATASFTTVQFVRTWRMQNFEPGFPSGPQIFGGVPFAIPATGFNIWASYNVGLPASRLLPVNVFGVDKVHTLMNTYWGEQAPGTLAAIEFNGSAGAFYHYDLDGNVDIRDWNNWPTTTNSINGTTTVNALTLANGSRLDRQTFTLPPEFHSQTLTSVRLIDNGAAGTQTIFLAGLTVQTIPEPASLAITIASALAWTIKRRASHPQSNNRCCPLPRFTPAPLSAARCRSIQAITTPTT